MHYTYIETKAQLQKESRHWTSDVGIDLECENNLHHYGTFICLIQLSTRDRNWIVDVLKLRDIDEVLALLKNREIQKIFHDVDFDFRMLNYQCKTIPKNVFDTLIAAELLGKGTKGLDKLIEEYFSLKKKSQAMADWTKRPLPGEMISYAVTDTKYLVRLRDQLLKELREKRREEWAREEFAHLEKKVFDLHHFSFWDMKGLGEMTPRQLSVLKRLFDVRDYLARKVNRPLHYIMPNKSLFFLAKNPPRSLADLQKMKGVHPIVKRKAYLFTKAAVWGSKEQLAMPKRPKKKRMTPKQRDHMESLLELRKKIAGVIRIEPHLILSKEQARELALGNKDCLRKWQRKLLEKNASIAQ